MGCRRVTQRPSGGGTFDTKRRRRVDGQPAFGDILAAGVASAVIAIANAPERDIDPLQFNHALAFLGFGHGLLLHRVHARQSADRLLVQRNRRPVFGRAFRLCLEVITPRFEPLARGVEVEGQFRTIIRVRLEPC